MHGGAVQKSLLLDLQCKIRPPRDRSDRLDLTNSNPAKDNSDRHLENGEESAPRLTLIWAG
eukprot:3864001-Pyramimonas_sp.AAC.1